MDRQDIANEVCADSLAVVRYEFEAMALSLPLSIKFQSSATPQQLGFAVPMACLLMTRSHLSPIRSVKRDAETPTEYS